MIPLKYVVRAEFPNNVILERVGDDLFLLRHGDYVWDWGIYNWSPRWVHDAHENKSAETQWFVGRYHVSAERILRDFDAPDAGCPGGPVSLAYGGLPPLIRPTWFR
jgi:hypothetical protein